VPDLVVDRQGAVVIATIDRPHARNAMGGTLLADLLAVSEDAAADDSVRAVVIAAAGPTYWCAGSDPTEFKRALERSGGAGITADAGFAQLGVPTLTGDRAALDDLGVGRWVLRFTAIDKPLIAAVNGWAVGGGFGLCLLHDIRIASTEARFAAGFVRAGLGPEHALSLTLPRAVGSGVAAELLMSGRVVGADEARSIGLVNGVVDPDRLLERAVECAESIARNPSLAVAATKRALMAPLRRELHDQLALEWRNQLVCFAAPDVLAAVLQRTDP
jgi:enoyl-CoA hydratase